MTLSPAATIVLTRAAERPDRRLEFHRKLPTGGRHKMIDALLRDGVITETQGDYRLGDGALLIEDSATGMMLTTLALTDAGYRALNLDPPDTGATVAPTAASDAAVAQEAMAVADALDTATVAPTSRATLRRAAADLLAAWDGQDNRDTDIIAALEAPMAALRTVLAEKAPRPDGTRRKPRQGTKQEAVLTMLRRDEGGHGRPDCRGDGLGQSHGPRLPGRVEEEEHPGQRPGASPHGRAQQGGRQGVLYSLHHPRMMGRKREGDGSVPASF